MCNAFCDSETHFMLDCTTDMEVACQDFPGNSKLVITDELEHLSALGEHGVEIGDVLEMVSCEPAEEAEYGPWHDGCTLEDHNLVLLGFRKIGVATSLEDGDEGDFVLVIL